MIRTETDKMARLLCDGCDSRTMLYPDAETAVLEMSLIGWFDIGGGKTIGGREFRHLCETCSETWKASFR